MTEATTPPPAKAAPPPARKRKGHAKARARAFVRKYVIGINTRSGVLFDLIFIGAVVAAILVLILESVPEIQLAYGDSLRIVESVVGTTFIVEYVMRIWVAANRWKYVRSFWGIIDLVAILPFLFQGFGLAYFRVLRILRIFAILKVAHYTSAASVLSESMVAAKTKIGVFLLTVVVLVIILGFTMNLVEPDTFPTVPEGIWWTVVTVTTVGFGDYVPQTLLGKMIASVAMITSFGIIAVPTGIVAAEMGGARRQPTGKGPVCQRCGNDAHVTGARYCGTCGERMSS